MSNKQDSSYKGIIFWNLIGYLLATVPPIVIDPKLTSHILFDPRKYSLGWLIIPISVILVITTYLVTRKKINSKARPIWVNLPFIVCLLLSLFIYFPEFPHGNLVFVGVAWLLFSVTNVYLQECKAIYKDIEKEGLPIDVLIEYYKQHIFFWRSVTIALIAGFFAVIITLTGKMQDNARLFLSKEDEIFLQILYVNIQLSVFSLYFFFGPVFAAFRKALEALNFKIIERSVVEKKKKNKKQARSAL